MADIYTDFARANGLRVASLDTLDAYAATGIHEADYRLLASIIVRTAAEDCECDEDEDGDDDSEAPSASESDDSDSGEDSGEAPDFGGEDDAEGDDEDSEDSDDSEDSEESDSDDSDDESEGDDDYGFGDDPETGGGEQYTVPEHAPELPPEMMQEIPQDDAGGSAPVPPEVIDSLLGLPEGTIEQLLLEEVEQGQGGGDGFGGPPQDGPAPAGPEQGASQGGGDDFFGGGGDEPEPPRTARRRSGSWEHHDFSNLSEDAMRRFVDNLNEGIGAGGEPGQINRDKAKAFERELRRRNAARLFWAADDDSSSDSDSGGGDSSSSSGGGGGGEQAAPAQDPNAMMGGDPNAAMGGGMMPPPGSQAVAPPTPPMPLENQPAEDALLDTAGQAIMQMIDRETQEYQQIIDPLSQALQAIQFAQQVEQSEHPLDVTPPQGTVDVSPSAAPGGAAPQPPMQQMARRRQAIFQTYPSEEAYRRSREDNEYAERMRNDPPISDPIRFSDEDVAYLKEQGQTPAQAGGGFDDWESYHRHHGSVRQAKIETALRNAAALIAHRYRLSATGHQMLVEATLGRRGYEHVVEALRLVPPDVRKAAAIHMSHLFAAGNQRFNKDVFLKTVMASNPRDRAGDAWRDGRDRGIAEHGRHDLDDFGDDLGDRFSPGGNRRHRPGGFDPHDHDEWVDGTDRRASRSRLPFELPRRTAGETWTHTPTMDVFEHPNAGEVARVDDGIAVNNLPKMVGADPHSKAAASQKAVDQFQRWQQRQQQRGLPITDGEAAIHDFLQTSRPHKKRVGPDAQNMIHRELGLQPDAVKTPKAKPVKAVNPVLKGKGGKTPAAPEAKAPAPKAAPKTASFFTRKVPGWRWDDYLNGYIAKEARNFTCACGEPVATPSYKTCKCGKIWNVYAIGDTHHLASDTADMFIAREIPVRPGVVMANRKMAEADGMYQPRKYPHNKNRARPEWADEDLSGFFDSFPEDERPDWLFADPPDDEYQARYRRGNTVKNAARSHQDLLAMIDKLADWTKYDGPDPSRDPKAKPPSTTIKSQPGDWTNRDFTGPTKGQWREPDPTELPRKTRKKK